MSCRPSKGDRDEPYPRPSPTDKNSLKELRRNDGALVTATLPDVTPKKRPRLSPELEAAKELVRQAREQGLSLTGPGGLLKQLTKTVLETALNEELTEHLGYDKHDPAGRDSGNIRNGTRPKTVLTEASGHVEIDVPRDRANRPPAAATGRGGGVGVFSAARSSIEAIFVTLITSSSSALPQAVLTRFVAVAAGQAEQPVDRASSSTAACRRAAVRRRCPRSWPCAAGGGDQPVQVAHRVGGLVLGQVVRVGRPAAGALPRVGLDQLAAVEHLDQCRVGPHVHGLSNVVLGIE